MSVSLDEIPLHSASANQCSLTPASWVLRQSLGMSQVEPLGVLRDRDDLAVRRINAIRVLADMIDSHVIGEVGDQRNSESIRFDWAAPAVNEPLNLAASVALNGTSPAPATANRIGGAL